MTGLWVKIGANGRHWQDTLLSSSVPDYRSRFLKSTRKFVLIRGVFLAPFVRHALMFYFRSMSRRYKTLSPFHHPEADEFDYTRLLDTLHDCRAAVQLFSSKCGVRNPAWDAAQTLLAHIDALALLTRIPGAGEQVRSPSIFPLKPTSTG